MHPVPPFAPFVVLTFLGTVGVTLLGGAGLVLTLLARRWRLAMGIALGLAVVGALYFAVLVAVSLASQEESLALEDRKYFCEVDCHEAYSLVSVRTAKTVGAPPHPAVARGTFYIVRVRVWFDPATIGTRRGNGPLTPNLHTAEVVDDSGSRYLISSAGQQALESAQGPAIEFTRRITPGESYETERVFDLPEGIKNPRLLISTPEWVTRLLIGHENSFFHKKTTFRLESKPNA